MGDQIQTLLGSHIRLVKGVSYRKIELVPGAGVKLVNLACVKPGGGFLFHGLKDYAGEFRHEQTLLPGDVAVALTDVTQSGSVIGRPIRVPGTTTPSVLVSSLDIAKIILTSEAVLLAWLYYRLQAPDYIGHVTGSATGTTVRHLSPLDVSRFSFALPPLSEQRAIAEVLGALDDKIEANRRTQASAESLARMLVAQARAEADLILSIGALVDRVTTILQPADIPVDATYVALEHMSRGSLFLSEFGTPEAVASAKATFRPKDILFGKLRPYFKKVAVAPSDGVCSTDILVLRAKSGDWAVASAVCASDEVIDYATAGSEGTRMPRVSWDYLSRLELPMPDYDQRIALQAEVAPLLELGMALSSEARRLAALRDALLPKLLSGELRVRDAEQLVEEVV